MKYYKVLIITSLIVFLIYSFAQFNLMWWEDVPNWTPKERFGLVSTFILISVFSLFPWAISQLD